MNRIGTFVSLIVVASLQTAHSLIAQQSIFEANVPFQFSVENKTLPAGEYRILRRGTFLLIGNDSSTVYAMASAGDPSRDGHSKLVFDKVNGSYFLRELETETSDSSLKIATSKAEKKAVANLRLASATPSDTKTIDLPLGGR